MAPGATLGRTLEGVRLFSPQERTRLAGDRATAYVEMVVALLAAGRLNRSFPDSRRLIALHGFLAPAACHHLYEDLEIGLSTGLPTERSVTRVHADHQLAPTVVGREEERPVVASRPEDRKRDRNYRYHRALSEADVAPAFALDLDLRRVDTDRRRAHFRTILDRFDLATETFVRYTILLSHAADRWNVPQVRLTGDDLEYTENFRNLVARTTGHDAELAFLLLSEARSIEVESVTRTRIGPLLFAGSAGPPRLQAIVDADPGQFVLCLPTDRAGIDIESDSAGDPFALGYRDLLPPEARQLVEARREGLGYHVRRERKFVATPGVAGALRDLLADLGKPSVVYSA